MKLSSVNWIANNVTHIETTSPEMKNMNQNYLFFLFFTKCDLQKFWKLFFAIFHETRFQRNSSCISGFIFFDQVLRIPFRKTRFSRKNSESTFSILFSKRSLPLKIQKIVVCDFSYENRCLRWKSLFAIFHVKTVVCDFSYENRCLRFLIKHGFAKYLL